MKCSRCGYEPSGKRSNPQNKYYWGVVVQTLSDETGYNLEEMHEIIKHKFLTEHRLVKGKKGEVIQMNMSGSTSKLDTKQFEDLMARIRIWASQELSIFILEPNEPPQG
jgi:hypothetical protein